jgi:hypothetical protein
MLNLALPLLRAVLASPMPALAPGGAAAGDDAHAPLAPVLPPFALVAAGYGFGPLRTPQRKTPAAKDPRRGRRK